jgi:hypothetical protein
MKRVLRLACVWSLVLASHAGADEFGSEALAMCEKVKQCAIDRMGTEDMTEQMRQSITPMLENMCVSMQEQFQQVPTDHELYQPALACMRSMVALSCEELMDGAADTAQCREYQSIVENYGE